MKNFRAARARVGSARAQFDCAGPPDLSWLGLSQKYRIEVKRVVVERKGFEVAAGPLHLVLCYHHVSAVQTHHGSLAGPDSTIILLSKASWGVGSDPSYLIAYYLIA